MPARRPAHIRPPAKKKRTLESRFRAPSDKGLHLLVQLAIIGIFGWAGATTVVARKHASSASLEPLVALVVPRPDDALDTDTQVSDEEAETAPPTLGPTPLAHEQKLGRTDARHSGDGAADGTSGSAKAPRLGTLDVESNPPATVWVDDKERGPTPIAVRVSAGQHQLNVVGPQGLTKRFRIDVPAGRRVKKVVTFAFTPQQPSHSQWP